MLRGRTVKATRYRRISPPSPTTRSTVSSPPAARSETPEPGPGYREWTGEDVKDFMYVMLYTGMRISDVATFDTSLRLHGNEIFLRMHKTKTPLDSWIPTWLVNRLRDREKRKGPRIFALSNSNSLSVQTERWRIKLQKVFDIAGPFDEKPVPHRMRHTSVRMLLERGVPV